MVKTDYLSVNQICQTLQISKGSFYHSKDPRDKIKEKYEGLKKYVKKIIKNNLVYGIRRIKTALLQDYQINIGRDKLALLLKLWGLELRRKIKKNKPSLIQKILKFLGNRTNLLIRTNLIKPFQVITSDISRFIYGQGKKLCYLAVHKDAFGQMVYGYKMGEKMEESLVIESFEKCCQSIRRFIFKIPNSIIFHQDQGSQYTGYNYVDKVLKVAKLSYSAPGTPTDNPGQESFFGRFKDEWKDEIYELETFVEVERFIAKKIKYYNNKRIHTSINYQNPYTFTKLFLKNVLKFIKI